jgi:hypothetical protein
MGRRTRPIRYEVVKELFDLSFAELARVSAVKSHQAARPGDVRLFSCGAVVT